MDFLYVAIIACLVVHVECLQCFTCHNLNSLNECNTTVQCGVDQACYHDKQGHTFSLGCIQNQQCGSVPSGGIVGRDAEIVQGVKQNRQTDHCMECCGKELCNKHLCGHLKPTACIDDSTVDCARLNTLVNLCQDIHHAKTICPKFCKLCTLGGAWSTWNAWTRCSVSCGGGLQTRSRACTNPQPSFFDLPCIGDTLQVQSCNDKRCPPLISAFSVGHPTAVQNGILGSFQTTVFNEGAQFNSSSGIFTCKIPGVYHFAATLVKASSNDEMRCGFLKNNERINSDSYWYLYLSSSNDQYAAVTLETLVRLVNGDQMQLGACTNGRTIQEWSTLNGYLLYPDV